MSALTWTCAKARGAITRRMATATVGAASAWFTAATIAGPWTSPLLELWAFGGFAVALGWNIKRALQRGSDDGTGGLFEKVKLAGVRPGEVMVAPNKVTVPLALPPGEVAVEDVQKASDKIAQVLRLHKGAVRITGDPDDLSQATMTVVPTDVLRHPVDWPGPSAPGGSITEPLVVGLYEDNEPVRLFLPGDKASHRNATHVVVQGMVGSGKTHGAKLVWTEIATRRDAALIVLDPSKGEQSVGFLRGHAHVVTGAKACAEFIRRVPEAITARASQLGQWGYDQWTPEVFERHGMPYVVLWVEEAPRVLEDATTIIRIAQEARSAGISLVLSLQKASFRQMSTDIRSQLGAVWCFGVKDIEDAAFTLSEEVIDAGARPDRWGNRRPGCFYLEAPGVDEDRYPVPARTFAATDDTLTTALTAHTHIRPGLGQLTAHALGLPEHPSTEGGAVVPITTAPSARLDTHNTDDLDALHLADGDDRTLVEPPEAPEPDLEGDADTALPAGDPEIRIPRPRPTLAEARALLRKLLDQLAASGRTTFTIRDLPDPEETFGRSRSWLSGELARLAGEGVLTEAGTDGKATVYRLPRRHAA